MYYDMPVVVVPPEPVPYEVIVADSKIIEFVKYSDIALLRIYQMDMIHMWRSVPGTGWFVFMDIMNSAYFWVMNSFLVDLILNNSMEDWLLLFFKQFYFEIFFLLIFIFLTLIKTTIISSKNKNSTKQNYFSYYIVFILFMYFIGLIIAAVIEFGTLGNILNFITLAYELDQEGVLNYVQLFFITKIFPTTFYINLFITIFYIGLVFFFIIFILFCIDIFARLKINSNEMILLLTLFLIFIRFLLNSFDLFAVYICLEGLTYIMYILVLLSIDKNIEVSEYSQKKVFINYFIANSVSSAFILLSISLCFALIGSLKFSAIFGMSYLSTAGILKINIISPVLFILLILFYAGIFFKLLVFPFFFWAHDFYENLPTFIFVLVNTFYKTIIFVTFVKLVIKFSFSFQTELLYQLLLYFGLFTFISGLMGALFASKIKIFLFYTSINQIGLLFIALGQISIVPQHSLLITIFYYFFIYMVCLFLFLILLYSIWLKTSILRPVEYMSDLKNLALYHPFIAKALSIFLFSFAGIPPFIGFFAKYELIMQIYTANQFFGIICIIGSIFSAFYYISIIALMHFNKFSLKITVAPLNLFNIFSVSKFGVLNYSIITFFLLWITFNWTILSFDYFLKTFIYFFIYY